MQVLSSGWSDWWNLAWSRDGEEIWFGASREGGGASLYAVNRAGRVRPLLSSPGTLEVHDIAPDGAVATAVVGARKLVAGGETRGTIRDLSWLEDSTAVDISTDGKQVLLFVTSEREQGGVGVYVRSIDGSPPIRLGAGSPQELSRDGRRVLAIRGTSLVSLPTGAGDEEVRTTALVEIAAARWMPGGTGVLVQGKQDDGRSLLAVASFDEKPLRALGKPFLARLPQADNPGLSPVSPDGRYVAVTTGTGTIAIVPLDGTDPTMLPGTGPNDLPVQWTADGRRLVVFGAGRVPAEIFEVDVTTGKRTLVRELSPPVATGVRGLRRLVMTLDGKAFAATWEQFDSSLYLVRGLK
jgi:Tol biopolymer transport system component